jgi:branched-chain amino acid transport system permease protein
VPRWAGLLAWALLLAAAVAMPFFTEDHQLLSTAVLLFSIAALATSWNIIGGVAGQISLGHAGFFGLGTLVTRDLWLGGSSLAVSMAAAVGVTCVLAVVVGVPVLRLRGIYFAIATLAVAEGVRLTISNIRPGISALSADLLRSYNYAERYFVTLGVLVLGVLASAWLLRSRVGLGMLALREDEEAARATGVNLLSHKLTAFVISAGLAGLAGGAYGHFAVSIYPSFAFGPTWSFDALLVSFVGGVGTLAGPLIGSAVFVLVSDVLASNLVEYHVVIFGAIFIVIVLLMPGGMVEGARRVLKMASGEGAKQK